MGYKYASSSDGRFRLTARIATPISKSCRDEALTISDRERQHAIKDPATDSELSDGESCGFVIISPDLDLSLPTSLKCRRSVEGDNLDWRP